ncbi:MAG: hypothetical protein V3U88_01680 [Methylococcales bacterium]
MNNDGTGFLLLTQPSQEAHRWSTLRLRWLRQEQKDQPECSSYFMHVPDMHFLVLAGDLSPTLHFSPVGEIIAPPYSIIR